MGQLEINEAVIREVVFRYQFDNNMSSGQRNVDHLFLAFTDGQDPPLEFLDRFVGQVPKVEPVSMSKVSSAPLIFRIESIQWIDGKTAKVDGGYYENRRSASGNTYLVERRDGGWVVTDDTLHWIS